MIDIRFNNNCNCIVDNDLLRKAVYDAIGERVNGEILSIYSLNGRAYIQFKGINFPLKRILMSYVLGRKLKKEEVVRSKNGNELDLSISNLEIGPRRRRKLRFNLSKEEYNDFLYWKNINNISDNATAIRMALKIAIDNDND